MSLKLPIIRKRITPFVTDLQFIRIPWLFRGVRFDSIIRAAVTIIRSKGEEFRTGIFAVESASSQVKVVFVSSPGYAGR